MPFLTIFDIIKYHKHTSFITRNGKMINGINLNLSGNAQTPTFIFVDLHCLIL